MLNALAVRGNRVLAERLRAAAAAGSFVDVGVAYVRFALDEPGLFAVMFRSDLLDNDDPELICARTEALTPLRAGARALGAADPVAAEMAHWGVVHGVATLALTGTRPAGTIPPAPPTEGSDMRPGKLIALLWAGAAFLVVGLGAARPGLILAGAR